MSIAPVPYIPEQITIHLGPPDSNAKNVTVSFPDYIKNVASSEIYPTWPVSSLVANIYSQISFALNKIYLEFYRSRGYQFDITNSTAYDQAFTPGRNIFENISQIVDGIFRNYIRREGYLEPLAASFCNGTTVTCSGLSQWGTVPLAQQGYTPYQILTNYFGDDISIVYNAPISGITSSYPGTPLRRGSRGNDVTVVQSELNRISQNYPAIPKVYPVDGIFGENTERAVKKFQQIFNLTSDGIVGEATWYKLVFLYVGIKRLAELESEGQSIFGLNLQYPDAVEEGDRGEKVTITQYFLALLSDFYETIPPIAVDGIFGPATKHAVIAFQKQFGLIQTGIVNDATWNAMYDAVKGISDASQQYQEKRGAIEAHTDPFPGVTLRQGSRGRPVEAMQTYLNTIAQNFPDIPTIDATGLFGPYTKQAVTAYQQQVGLPATGMVDETTWYAITDSYYNAVTAGISRFRQYPGRPLQEGSTDAQFGPTSTVGAYTGKPVKSLQEMLRQIARAQGIPIAVIPDGIFGTQTTAAVKKIQREGNMEQTGVVDNDLWDYIVVLYDAAAPGLAVCQSLSPQLKQGGSVNLGDENDDVYFIQILINGISGKFPNTPIVTVNGSYDQATQQAVSQLQGLLGLPQNGVTDVVTWNRLHDLYQHVRKRADAPATGEET